MSRRLRLAIVAGIAALLTFGALLLWVYRWRTLDRAGLLARLPTNQAVVVWIDFAALRRGGVLQLLSNSKTPEEPEYRQFIASTGFDYKRDLDQVMASFGPAGEYFLVRGRFEWMKLRAYAAAQGGSCRQWFCTMPGSKPERNISFYPLRDRIMALAVSRDSQAARDLAEKREGQRALDIPADPVWLSVPAATLNSTDRLPTGTRMFAQSMGDAEEITLSAGPQGGAYEARLNVRCRSEKEATRLVEQLERTTALLRKMIDKQHGAANSRDLSGVLTAGVFSRKEARVFGRWPLPQEFLRDTLSGSAP